MVTWHDLIFSLLATGGLLVLGYGAMHILGAGMSSNPAASEDAFGRGCFLGIVGLVFFVGSCAAVVL